MWHLTALSRAQFSNLYLGPVERYAALVQDFPASESHHHAYAGGLLDHTLEIVAYALKLRQSHLLPVGAPPETQALQAEAWTAAAAYAALLHDVGKIAVDLHVEYADGEPWHPWHGSLQRPYRFRYRTDRTYRLHSAAAGLLYTTILGQAILDWLCEFPELWASLLYALAGQYENAGVLADIVTQADQASVAQELGGDPAKARAAPKHALQRKLLDGLRYLLKEELRLNQRQASDGWLTQDGLWLVSKTVCDKLRAHLAPRRHCKASHDHQRQQSVDSHRRRHRLPRQSRHFSALCPRAPAIRSHGARAWPGHVGTGTEGHLHASECTRSKVAASTFGLAKWSVHERAGASTDTYWRTAACSLTQFRRTIPISS
jgi:integrating conjugative element relaxase (TIGR03760 family)